MTPDAALYAMLADNLAAGEGYTLWGAPHTHVPPGYPALLAAVRVPDDPVPYWNCGSTTARDAMRRSRVADLTPNTRRRPLGGGGGRCVRRLLCHVFRRRLFA